MQYNYNTVLIFNELFIYVFSFYVFTLLSQCTVCGYGMSFPCMHTDFFILLWCVCVCVCVCVYSYRARATVGDQWWS